MTEGGWYRPHDHVRTLREHDGNDKPLAEGDNNNGNKYNKDSNIPNDSVPPAESIARLRPGVSAQACPHAESIILSAGMSIILSVPPLRV